MPELPEVETIRRGLERHIVGKAIVGVELRFEKIFSGKVEDVIGAKIMSIRRFGKGLVIDLSNGFSITAHVKMTGQFVYFGEDRKNFHPNLSLPTDLPNKHTHVIFTLNSPAERHAGKPEAHPGSDPGQDRLTKGFLFYNDIRKFGWLKVVKTDEVFRQPFFKGLGPEPFSTLTLPLFKKIVLKSSLPIKILLMDQRKMSGIGNIYANDALYASRIDPRRKGNELTKLEQKVLYTAVLEVLTKGLELGGASENTYIQVDGGKGSYQDHFLVYGKNGKKCLRCGNLIERIKQGGRSTFYCPTCQS